ncbi:hypothetical protein PGTUg99_004299 [Puccinia graminis f. sp. tritici]|uniref:Uncharacterized protein n=1 Tax=Puccinia graminis f. sp. tritici TaxID=56615 RepID=A0A5B0PC98_PUCGR|nr:hypothetical protein PGTUg99_004299 [Puccinia graminis f. sp. tritici]
MATTPTPTPTLALDPILSITINDNNDQTNAAGEKKEKQKKGPTYHRDGPVGSGYPRGCRYPLTISAESGIRIRLRVSAGAGGYPRGYPRIPALLLVDAGEGDFFFTKNKKSNWPPSAQRGEATPPGGIPPGKLV